MTFEAIQADLAAHEARSQTRYETLLTHLGDTKMADPVHIKNIFEPGTANPMAGMLPLLSGMGGGSTGAAVGGGLGAGLLGGILGGVLLNRGGLLGGADGGGGVVTPAMLTSGLASVIDSNQNTTLLQSIGDVKAAVPLAEAQVQLALAGVQNDINRAISGSQSDITSILTANATAGALANQLTNQNIANSTATILASESAIKDTVAQYGVANLSATKDSQYATAVAISASTKEIIAALNDQNTANLQRQLTVAEQALTETRVNARSREVEVNVTQTVTQNQAQLQAQNQAQQQFQILAQLSAAVANLANDVQVVRQGQTIFNSGTMAASGTQTAANTRVS